VAEESKSDEDGLGRGTRRHVSAAARARLKSEVGGEQEHVGPTIDVVPCGTERVWKVGAFETLDR
jgi:hypothetical protein